MKKFLILFFMLMTVFILPSFASPPGGGGSILELSIPSFVDADLSITESQAEFPDMGSTFINVENIAVIGRSKMSILSKLSAMKANIKLKAIEELMLRKTTVGVLSGNLIRYVRQAA